MCNKLLLFLPKRKNALCSVARPDNRSVHREKIPANFLGADKERKTPAGCSRFCPFETLCDIVETSGEISRHCETLCDVAQHCACCLANTLWLDNNDVAWQPNSGSAMRMWLGKQNTRMWLGEQIATSTSSSTHNTNTPLDICHHKLQSKIQ